MSLLLTSSVALMVLLAGWVDLVFAQSLNVTFMNNFLGVLDSMDLKNFTALVAQVTNGGDSSFATSLSDASSPKTLFVPNNNAFTQPGANFIGVDFLANDTQFLSSVLLYHLLDRKWTQNQLSTTSDTLLQTFLRGNNITFLENNSPQMIAGAQSSNGFQIVNQAQDTFVLQTFQYEHVTVQVINEIVGIPGPFTATIHTAGLTTLANLQAAAGYGTGLDTAIGLTVFAPFDDGFEAVREQIANTSATSLLNNHIIIGKTVRGSDFQFSQHTSQSLMNYTFNQDPMSEKFTVTLNGVTVNIVRTDFLVNNGVIHLVDGVLFNTTVPDLLAVPTPVSSTDISSPSSSSPNLASSMLSYAQPTMTNNATNGCL
ncbi:hypothetical protein BDY19DRAFT_364707 [Irpex rosettiformis]|uniref:Uncharacterized protein n=1 Tax=Irpex rosettiformis TaxID=378272 RepID=A0ACB8TVY0_9APHY|nr:hypothetical protein BDY19DRAFT_364707 [Irpex rosettiformis]